MLKVIELVGGQVYIQEWELRGMVDSTVKYHLEVRQEERGAEESGTFQVEGQTQAK